MRKLLIRLSKWIRREPDPPTPQEMLQHARKLEAIQEGVCKLLKCKPDEMLTKINKIQANILEMEAEIKKLEEANKVIDKSK